MNAIVQGHLKLLIVDCLHVYKSRDVLYFVVGSRSLERYREIFIGWIIKIRNILL